ncbi:MULTISPECIES: FecR domain-containing protein [unclassified Pseudodesulfovibrio]|uniref:FecR family protein n=1 Tax=unclassified Pseudodesulfovibrio TaxID=2661612 RepID=UPI0013E33E98|nr:MULTISPECIES: FecR domain-containing protein [unclassified Pseudodesulfovibrio]MCJ2165405.1 FecR domain-containing protein [Pseudodesulfovibrio sp. S3-i]
MSYCWSSHLRPDFSSSPGKKFTAAVLAVVLLMTLTMVTEARSAERAQTIGSVKTVSGTACLGRNGEQLPAKVGDYLLEGDTLITGADSSMGVIFRDDTLLSLGSRSQVRIDAFVFDPAQDNMNFLTNVTKGTAQYISGQIAKLSPEKMSVETPLSTIGIRGTRFLVKVD